MPLLVNERYYRFNLHRGRDTRIADDVAWQHEKLFFRSTITSIKRPQEGAWIEREERRRDRVEGQADRSRFLIQEIRIGGILPVLATWDICSENQKCAPHNRERTNLCSMHIQVDIWAIGQKYGVFSLSVRGNTSMYNHLEMLSHVVKYLSLPLAHTMSTVYAALW
jgi:hypothetical protein